MNGESRGITFCYPAFDYAANEYTHSSSSVNLLKGPELFDIP